MPPITIDFEASCLPRDGRSFPIEVGISDGAGNERAWLIRPHADWAEWTWTREAEHLHGISREELEREGLPVETVLNELNAAIGKAQVIADNWLDAVWLETLCHAARAPAGFAIVHIADILDDLAPTDAQIHRADEAVAAMGFRRHRASEDARHLALWLAALTGRKSALPRAAARRKAA